jgi:hypothetical protein
VAVAEAVAVAEVAAVVVMVAVEVVEAAVVAGVIATFPQGVRVIHRFRTKNGTL